MGRRRKAWLSGGDGNMVQGGKRLPGFYVEWNEYPGGKRVHRSRNFSTAKLARDYVRQFNARLELRLLNEVVPISLRDAATEFAEGLTTLNPETTADYLSSLGFLGSVVGEHQVVGEITGEHLDRFIAERGRISTEATVARHIRNLRRFFNWATKRGYLGRSPLETVTARPSDKQVRERPVITEELLGKMIGVLDTEDRRVAVWLAMTTGLDRGVIERLCTSQISTEESTIRIQRPKTRRKTRQMLETPIHPTLLPMLSSRLNQSEPLRPILSGLSRQNDKKDWWKIAAGKIGMPKLLFRDLRAVAAARPQRLAGLSLADAQKLLGHSSPEVTAGHYNPPNPDVVRRLASLPLPGAPTAAKRMRGKPGTSGHQESGPS